MQFLDILKDLGEKVLADFDFRREVLKTVKGCFSPEVASGNAGII